MYVIVVYDAGPEEQTLLRAILVKQLHRIQNSVFAGEMTNVEIDRLHNSLANIVVEARVHIWRCDRPPHMHDLGRQEDKESPFI